MNPYRTGFYSILYLLIWTCCSWPWTAMAAEAVPWDFESGNAEWQSRGKSVTVERVMTTGANGQRTPSLRIHGRIEDGWNYANSHPVPMTAGKLYPKDLGLRRFVRHLVFVKPDVLLVADDIRLDKPLPLELRFHPEQQAERSGTAFVAKGTKAVLRIEPLSTEGVQVSGESLPLPNRHGEKQSGLFAIRLATQRAAWRNAVALSWCPAEREPAKVVLRAEDRRWTFVVGVRKLVLDWDTGKVD